MGSSHSPGSGLYSDPFGSSGQAIARSEPKPDTIVQHENTFRVREWLAVWGIAIGSAVGILLIIL